MEGAMTTAGKLAIGYFTQYQVEELAGSDTPLLHMTRAMAGKTPAAVRAQLGRFGFSGDKATTEVSRLSGGERARLALALVTRDAPHLLILDEPTNHLDVDAREALVQALNAYQGAVILISHDRHMVELTADRLVLVDGGAASLMTAAWRTISTSCWAGTSPRPMRQPRARGPPAPRPRRSDKAATQAAWQARRELGKQIAKAEKDMAKLQARIAEVDAALADPAKAPKPLAGMNLARWASCAAG
jgi:ATP-binding cassette subfamily F protein 3